MPLYSDRIASIYGQVVLGTTLDQAPFELTAEEEAFWRKVEGEVAAARERGYAFDQIEADPPLDPPRHKVTPAQVAAEPPPLTAAAADEVQLVPQPDGTREPEPIESDRQAAVPTRQALDEALDILEADAVEVVMGALRPVMDRMAARIASDHFTIQALRAAAVDDLTSILEEWGAAVDATVLPYYERVYRLGGLSAVSQMVKLGGAVPSDFARLEDFHLEAAARHLAVSRNRFMQLGNSAWFDARTVMLRGLEQGYGIDRIARELRDVTDLSAAEARLIARTEVISAANAGAYEQAKLAGAEAPLYKQWVATMDRRTRPTHDAADGQVVHLDTRFLVGGAYMQYPGDPAGPAEETYNCRCSLVFTDDPAGLHVEEGRQTGGVIPQVAEAVDTGQITGDVIPPYPGGMTAQNAEKWMTEHWGKVVSRLTPAPGAPPGSNLVDRAIYLQGLGPKAADDAAAAFDALFRDFPVVANEVRFVGESARVSRLPHIGPYYTRIGPRAYADASETGQFIRLSGSKARDYDKLIASLKADEEAGWHPPGMASVKGILDHEFGHHVHYMAERKARAAGTLPAMQKEIENAIARAGGVSKWTDPEYTPQHRFATVFSQVSKYAVTNDRELAAEAFAYWRSSKAAGGAGPTLRPALATEIAEIILRYAGEDASKFFRA